MKRLLTFSLIALMAVVGSHFTTPARAEDDPGTEYVDAYMLIQEGDTAKAKSDWRTAYNKYNAAQTTLQGIKDKTPNWNTHIVTFRLQYCSDQIAAIKPNLTPQAPPLAATLVAPPKPAPAAAIDRAELEKLQKQLADLKKQNANLTAELQAAQAKPAPAAPVIDTAELDNLRKQAAEIRTQLDASAKQVEDLAQQNKSLTTALTEARNKPAPAPDTTALDGLRAQLEAMTKLNQSLTTELAAVKNKPAPVVDTTELDKLRAQLAETQKQLAAAKTIPVPVPSPSVNTAELDKLRAQLADQSKLSDAQLAELRKQNTELAGQLTALRQSTSTERTTLATQNRELTDKLATTQDQVQDLQRQLSNATATGNRGFVFTTPPASYTASLNEIKKQNLALNEQLGSAKDRIASLQQQRSIEAKAGNARVSSLISEIADLKQQQQELAGRLAAAQRKAAEPKTAVASTASAAKEGNRGFLFRSAAASASAEETMRDARRENRRLASQVAHANEQIAALQKQLASKKLAAESNQLNVLRSELQVLQEAKEAGEARTQRLREEAALLRQLLNRYAAQQPELKRQIEGRPINPVR